MINEKLNPCWAVYKNIEREVIELSNSIYFCKEHFCVYSIKISELLVRCVVEIESIAKDLWKLAGSTPRISGGVPAEPNFDGDCLNFLDKKWALSKKEIKLALSNICIEEEYRILVPLKNAGKKIDKACKNSGAHGIDDCICCSNWNNAYQNIKHNRAKSLQWASVKHILDAMGAAFLFSALGIEKNKQWKPLKITLYICAILCFLGYFGSMINTNLWYIASAGYGFGTLIICIEMLIIEKRLKMLKRNAN